MTPQRRIDSQGQRAVSLNAETDKGQIVLSTEIPLNVISDVGQRTSQWNAVERGLTCLYWGTVSSAAGFAIVAGIPLLLIRFNAMDLDPQDSLVAFVVTLVVGIGASCMSGGAILLLFGICLSCASPQNGPRIMAIICLAALFSVCFIISRSIMGTYQLLEVVGRGGRTNHFQDQLPLLLMPINILNLISNLAMVAYLYLTAQFFAQKRISDQIFKYVLYQVGAGAAVPLLFAFGLAYTKLSAAGASPLNVYVFLLQGVVILTLLVVGLMWYLRNMSEVRIVVRRAIQKANEHAVVPVAQPVKS